MNALRTPVSTITLAASSGSKRPRGPATIGRPRYSDGTSASISPPIQAQSAGVQKTSLADREVAVRELEAGHVAEERAVGVEDALRLGRRARGVDQERGVLRGRPDAGRGGRAVAQEVAEAAMRRRRLAVDDDRDPELGRELGDRLDQIRGHDQDAGVAVGQAVTQRVGPEELAERERDGPGLVDGEVRGRGRRSSAGAAARRARRARVRARAAHWRAGWTPRKARRTS